MDGRQIGDYIQHGSENRQQSPFSTQINSLQLLLLHVRQKVPQACQLSVRWLQVVLGGQLTSVSLNRRWQDLIRRQDETVPPSIA